MTIDYGLMQELYEGSSKTLAVIGAECGCTHSLVSVWAKDNYTPGYRSARKRENYRTSKLGDKNPMRGKTGDAHHNKKERVSDCKGYFMVLKPEWYTGRKGSKHIFEHHYIYCLAVGITEIPKGMVLHHLDEDKTNNSRENLIMLSNGDHGRLHRHMQNVSGKGE